MRRGSVNALLRLAARTGGKPGSAIRVTARGLERTLKRAERAVAPRQPQAPSTAGAWDAAAAEQEYATLLSAVVHRLVRVGQPLVLILRAPRSGGTLLMRFDGHRNATVPRALDAAARVAAPAREGRPGRCSATPMLATGSSAACGRARGGWRRQHPVPFLLPPLLQRQVFDHVLASGSGIGPHVLDATDLLLQRLARLPALLRTPLGDGLRALRDSPAGPAALLP
jgi:hypothetical protein